MLVFWPLAALLKTVVALLRLVSSALPETKNPAHHHGFYQKHIPYVNAGTIGENFE